MAEVKVWFGLGMWYCNAGCTRKNMARWHTGFSTPLKVAGEIIDHINQHHPELASDVPYIKHGEWRRSAYFCDLTPASDG